MTHPLQAADAVLALINAQPRTPTREEIAAIIQRTMQPVPPEQRLLRALLRPDFPMAQDPPPTFGPPPAELARWDGLVRDYIAFIEGNAKEPYSSVDEEIDRYCRQHLGSPRARLE